MKTKTLTARIVRGLPAGARPRVIISTDALDDQRDRIMQAGLTFRPRMRVLYAHQYNTLPVGLVTNIDRYPHRTEAEWTWFENDAEVERVRNIYEQNALDASLGANVDAAASERNAEGGYNITKAHVVEISLTPVPANAGAVALAKSLGRAGAVEVDVTREQIRAAFEATRPWLAAEIRRKTATAVAVARAPREFDLAAIGEDDVLEGLTPAGVRAAFRAVLPAMVDERVRRALRIARGRLD
ncbi:MAG: hypothetical protein HY725_11785 [Candidatus Rokubacteria bacterium]|nr:hypothetical protein [Candidatus Rokubacteria bacterium]